MGVTTPPHFLRPVLVRDGPQRLARTLAMRHYDFSKNTRACVRQALPIMAGDVRPSYQLFVPLSTTIFGQCQVIAVLHKRVLSLEDLRQCGSVTG